jgi:Flp pilus assembly protein TadG
MPVLMLMTTGVYSFGTFLQQQLALTDAVNTGAKLLSINRGNTLDPCNLVYTAVTNAAPALDPTQMTFTYTLDGQAESGSTCSSSTSTTGAPSYLVQGTPITVKVTYPCSLAIYQANLVPNCTMTAQLTEIEQ